MFSNLPDIWFDWYARLLPGTFGVFIFDFSFNHFIFIFPTFERMIVIIIIGYIVGPLIQPLVGAIIKVIEKREGVEDIYRRAKPDPNTKESSLRKVSKFHTEANSMLACALFLAVNVIYFWGDNSFYSVLYIVLFLYCLWAMVQRIKSRSRKIKDLTKLHTREN